MFGVLVCSALLPGCIALLHLLHAFETPRTVQLVMIVMFALADIICV